MSKEGGSDFGTVADDGLGNSFFLSMDGTSANPHFGYDRLAHKAHRKEGRQEEAQNVKALLKEEIGLFKGDQTIEQFVDKTPETKTTISIDDSDKPKEEKKGLKKRLKGFGNKEDKVTISLDDDDEDF